MYVEVLVKDLEQSKCFMLLVLIVVGINYN